MKLYQGKSLPKRKSLMYKRNACIQMVMMMKIIGH